MVAVTGYDPHPITRTLSLTFFPGIAAADRDDAGAGVEVTPLSSSRDSYTRPVPPAEACATRALAAPAAAGRSAGDRAARAGHRRRRQAARRAAARRRCAPWSIGDGDFASNSFLPYMANSDLLLAVGALAGARGARHRRRAPASPCRR